MKKNLFTYLFLGSVFCFVGKNTAFAQGEYKCGTTQMHNKVLAEHPEIAQTEIEYNALIDQLIKTKRESKSVDSNHVFIIPIVFHILHVNGTENISDAQIIDQVNILNRDYRKLNADIAAIVPPFQPKAADIKIEFRLAQIDPNGNCTNGIDRIYSHKTDNANDDSKLNPWPRQSYLNVWVIRTMESVGTAGYAYYPSATAPWYMEPRDGIIIIHNYIGSIGTGTVGQSRALTHEVGHWLNLPHTWGSTNNPEVACGDEGVNDTPITSGHDNCGNRYDFECDSKALTGTYTFGSVTTASGTTDPSVAPEATDSAITFSNPIAVGVSTNSASASMFEFSNWGTGALNGETSFAALTGSLDNSKYYEFSITPDLAQALTMTGITFNVKRDTNGIRTFAIRSNADGYAANLAASITPSNPNLSVQAGNIFFINFDTTVSMTGSKITLSGANFTNINNTTRTFRIYGWNAEDINGTFGVDNIAFTGTHGIVENVENYMEYSYCSKMFTEDQKWRMRAALELSLSARDNLWIGSNLAATGTDGSGVACAPKPDFYANRTMVCPGGTVTFTKNISSITPTFGTIYTSPTVTSSWTFTGGTPSTSTAANPVVTYSTPGAYEVTLTTSYAGGTATSTKTNYIYVSDGFAQVPATYTEDFENATEFWSHWMINDLDNNGKTWYYSSAAGYNSTHSAMMNPYYSYAYDVDQLISPSFDLSFVSSPTLTFRCAAATTATVPADMNDKLIVSSSTDCGATWSVKRTFTGAGTATGPSSTTLINNGYHPEEYIPSAPGEWALLTVTGITASNKTRVKFEYVTGKESNSIYIDDVNISGVVGVDENSSEAANVAIFPNPTSQSSTVSYHLNKKGDVTIVLVDVLGKQIMQVNNKNQTEGDYSIEISKNELNLQSGIYFVKFTIDNTTITKKLVISE